MPFCDTEGLANIIQRDGDCIWLENKFKTLRATRQTVLIESANHDADLVTYEPDELHHVIRFALGCWQQMIDSQQYRSVLMYKNKGPLSGGSLVHPHMQIVGLERENGYAALAPPTSKASMFGGGEGCGQHLNRADHGIL